MLNSAHYIQRIAFLFLLLVPLSQQIVESQNKDRRYTIERGLWSRDTILLTYYDKRPMDEKRKEISIPSPDGKLVARVEAVQSHEVELPGLAIYQNGGKSIGRVLLENHPEMAWAPDSKAFFINETDGNSVNGWSLRLFVVGQQTVKESKVTKYLQNETTRHFRKRPWTVVSRQTGQNDCEADTAGVRWMDGSARLLVVARIPNTSYCRNMMSFAAFVISVPSGKIVERISEAEFKKSYWEQTDTIFP